MELSPQWIAGFFDGEGCISIQSDKGLRVIFINTRRDVLLAVSEGFGGVGKLKVKKRIPGERGTRPCYQWITWGREAQRVLETLLPYLVIKKSEAEVALEFQSLIVQRLPGQTRGPRAVTAEVWQRRRELAEKCSDMKRATCA